jgi:hypothetical protein
MILNSLADESSEYKTIEDLRNVINPSAAYKYEFILLDTDNADADLTTDTKYGWKLVNYPVRTTGTISVSSMLRDIVGMRVYPITTNLLTPVGEPDKVYFNNVVNINNSFNILIEEFSAQSYIAKNGRRFHFDLFPSVLNLATQTYGPSIVPANPYVEYVTSGKGNGWFWFRTPIVSCSTITISMANPYDLVKFDNNTRTLIPIQLILRGW